MKYSSEVARRGVAALDKQGLTPVHELLLALTPPESKVLEIGCAAGHLSQALRAQGCKVTGVEMVKDLADIAEGRVDRLIRGDLQQAEVQNQVEPDQQVIVMADVVEHFEDPWKTVQDLKLLAAPDAIWLITFPNIAHWQMRMRLLRGKWEYTDFGLLDRTHLRFFNLASSQQFLREVSLGIEEFYITEHSYPVGNRVLKSRLLRGLDTWLAYKWPNLLGAHFLYKARSLSGGIAGHRIG